MLWLPDFEYDSYADDDERFVEESSFADDPIYQGDGNDNCPDNTQQNTQRITHKQTSESNDDTDESQENPGKQRKRLKQAKSTPEEYTHLNVDTVEAGEIRSICWTSFLLHN